jgi:rSAM/selenodomain-associated transferase 2/rSAM/selenodomain-associated transferase 1
MIVGHLWERSGGTGTSLGSARLIVFTRFPEPGQTKTRLIGRLGAVRAADLQREMTTYTLAAARAFAARGGAGVEVRYEGGDEALISGMFGGDLRYVPQGGGDLGDRLARAVATAFEEGAGAVLVIGTDCPGVTADLLDRALGLLQEDARRVVLGPARDGGYYLIGLGRDAPELFGKVAWGTEHVLDQTVERARQAGLEVWLLEALADVDRPEDLDVWYSSRDDGRGRAGPTLSVIIPALNEEAAIARAVDSATAAESAEVIVVDGGSRDRTVAVARSRGAAVIVSPPGRARQMNAGAARARGDLCLFLHADSVLPAGYDRLVAEVFDRPGTVAGAFRLEIEDGHPAFRGIEALVHWRSTSGQLPYGDQAIFLRTSVFREIGGYPEVGIMEDVELIRRLRARGCIRIVPASVRTSARRWLQHGIFRTTLLNQCCLVAYWLGVPTSRIATWRRAFTG